MFPIGYGDYEREVRVAGLLEDISIWSTGTWIGTDRLYKLELNDSLEAIRDCTDATDRKRIIKKGTICRFRGWDDDADALIRYTVEGRKISTVVFVNDFHLLTLR